MVPVDRGFTLPLIAGHSYTQITQSFSPSSGSIFPGKYLALFDYEAAQQPAGRRPHLEKVADILISLSDAHANILFPPYLTKMQTIHFSSFFKAYVLTGTAYKKG